MKTAESGDSPWATGRRIPDARRKAGAATMHIAIGMDALYSQNAGGHWTRM